MKVFSRPEIVTGYIFGHRGAHRFSRPGVIPPRIQYRKYGSQRVSTSKHPARMGHFTGIAKLVDMRLANYASKPVEDRAKFGVKMRTCKHGYNSDDEGTESCYPTVNGVWGEWGSDTDSDMPALSPPEGLPDSDGKLPDQFGASSYLGNYENPRGCLEALGGKGNVDVRADTANLLNINPNITPPGAQPTRQDAEDPDTVANRENSRFHTGSGGSHFSPTSSQVTSRSSGAQWGKGWRLPSLLITLEGR